MKIYHIAKKQNLSLFQLQDMVHYQNLTERRLGCLPYDWLKNLKPDEFSKATKDVDEAFQIYAKKSGHVETLEGISKQLVKKLKKILKRDDISMMYIGNGYYKECSKLTVGKFKYAFITMFEKFGYHPGDARAFGKYAEPQAIFFTYKKMPHGRVAKPFMSRFSTDYDEYGYMLNKFIDENDLSRAKTPLNPLRDRFREYYIADSRERGNMINNIIIDAGGIERNENYIKDKNFRRNLFVFFDRIYPDMQNARWRTINNDGLINSKTVIPAEKFLTEQMDKGVDIFKADLRELLKPLNDEQQLYAKKLIRRLRNTHKLKCDLKAQGKYDSYKTILEKFKSYCSEILTKELELT